MRPAPPVNALIAPWLGPRTPPPPPPDRAAARRQNPRGSPPRGAGRRPPARLTRVADRPPAVRQREIAARALWPSSAGPTRRRQRACGPSSLLPSGERSSAVHQPAGCQAARLCLGMAGVQGICGALLLLVPSERELGGGGDARLSRGVAVLPPMSRVGRCSYRSSSSAACTISASTTPQACARPRTSIAPGRRPATTRPEGRSICRESEVVIPSGLGLASAQAADGRAAGRARVDH
jgi:hypothetical protein